MKTDNIEEIKKNIEQNNLLESYSLFYTLYKESFEMNNIYMMHKNKFNDSNFDEENNKFFEINLKKIEFLYNNTIPYDDLTIKPNTFIIKNFFLLIFICAFIINVFIINNLI